jgi:hypothetical protein
MKGISLTAIVAVYSLLGSNAAWSHELVIVNQASGLVVSAGPGPHVAGQALIQEPQVPCNPYQRWVLRPVGDGSYQVVNLATGLALETLKGDSRTPVSLFPCRPVPTQHWWVSRYGDSYHYELIPVLHNNRSLDVPGGRAQISVIQIYKSNASDAQRWSLMPAR